jgi:hypothetical protein
LVLLLPFFSACTERFSIPAVGASWSFLTPFCCCFFCPPPPPCWPLALLAACDPGGPAPGTVRPLSLHAPADPDPFGIPGIPGLPFACLLGVEGDELSSSSSFLNVLGPSRLRRPGGRYAPVATGLGEAATPSLPSFSARAAFIACTFEEGAGAGERARGKVNCDEGIGLQAAYYTIILVV